MKGTKESCTWEEWGKKRKELADLWQADEYKALLEEVLGERPEGPIPNMGDAISAMLGLW